MISGAFTARAQTNGIYARSESFRTAQTPIVTLSMMHGSMPTEVFGKLLTNQQAT